MIRFIRSQGLEVEMFANGSRITAEVARQLFEERVTVVLKMDTFDEGIRMLPGKGSFSSFSGHFRT